MSKGESTLWRFIEGEITLRKAADRLKCTMTTVYIRAYKLLKKTYHEQR